MSNFKTVAYLTPGHELWEIFPDGEVPVRSFVAQIFGPDLEPCFLLDENQLTDEQFKSVAEHVMQRWPNLFCDEKEAKESVRQGFPFLESHFCGGKTEDLDALLAALDEMLNDYVDDESLDDDGVID